MIHSIPSVLLQSDLFAQVTCRDLKIEDTVEQNIAKCGVCFNPTFSPAFQYLVASDGWKQRNSINAAFGGYYVFCHIDPSRVEFTKCNISTIITLSMPTSVHCTDL